MVGVAIVGPSGCGKTTLMRMAAGLDFPTDGRVLVGGREVTGPGPERAVVFQQFALLPWKTVRENIGFGLMCRRTPKAEADAAIARCVELMGLSGHEESFPHQLSGGMQQRVAIARAYVMQPAAMLMDEPFGALDAQTRIVMQEELVRLARRNPRTVIFITHPLDEAIFLVDRVLTGRLAGRRVAVNPVVVPGDCPFACDGRAHLSPRREILSMPPRPGAFAGLVRAPEENLVEIPDDLRATQAALAEPVAVSFHAVHRGARLLGRPLPASRCVVLGGGAIGLAAALVLVQAGAGEVWVVEPNPARRETAERAGLALVRAPDHGPPDGTCDLVVDAVGAAATRTNACRLARPGGAIVHAGLLPGSEGLDVRRLTLQEIIFTGTYCYTPQEFRTVVGLLSSRRLGALDSLEERPLAEGARAIAAIDAHAVAAAKIVLIP